MDIVDKSFHILYRQAPEALLAFPDHIGDVGEFFGAQAADAPDEILRVFGKMVGDRRQNRLEHMAGGGTGLFTPLRCKFLQDRDILVIEFTWHGECFRIIILRAQK